MAQTHLEGPSSAFGGGGGVVVVVLLNVGGLTVRLTPGRCAGCADADDDWD